MARDGRLDGREIGGRWLLDPDAVLALAKLNRKRPRAYRSQRRAHDAIATT